MATSGSRSFTAVVERDRQGRVMIRLPFDPSDAWGNKTRHHVTGTVGDRRVRGSLTGEGLGARLVMGPAWCRGSSFATGDKVRVALQPEGPQQDTLAPDLAAALAAQPEAGAYFGSLATFYRKGYLRWVDATSRRPELRAARIAEMVELLSTGHKQRPR